jgi:hypothetical protein
MDGLVERTHTFDVALVLDTSKSMDTNTCHYFRDVIDDPEGYTTYGANNVYPVCTSIVGDDFEMYGSTDELMVEWYKTGDTSLHTSGGHDGGHWVEVSEGEFANTFDVSGQQDVAVYFWMKNMDMDDSSGVSGMVSQILLPHGCHCLRFKETIYLINGRNTG